MLSSVTGDGTDTGLGNNSNAVFGVDSNFWNTLTSTGAFNPAQVVQAITGSTFTGAGIAPWSDGAGGNGGRAGTAGRLGHLGSGRCGRCCLGRPGQSCHAGAAVGATVLDLDRDSQQPTDVGIWAHPRYRAPQTITGDTRNADTVHANASNAAAVAPKYGFRSSVIVRSPMAG